MGEGSCFNLVGSLLQQHNKFQWFDIKRSFLALVNGQWGRSVVGM